MLKNNFLYGVFLFLSFAVGYFVNELSSRDKNVLVEVNTKPSYSLFMPNYNVTFQSLVKEGFKPVEVDVIVLQKDLNADTNIQYFIQEYKDEYYIGVEMWFIKFDTFDLNVLKEYFNSNNALIITDLCEEEKNLYRFFVRSTVTDLLFQCRFYIDEEGQPILTIEHQYPSYARGGVMKDHPMFQQ